MGMGPMGDASRAQPAEYQMMCLPGRTILCPCLILLPDLLSARWLAAAQSARLMC